MEMEDEMLAEGAEDAQENKYLLFKLGDEEYGIDIGKVQSIEELQKIVAVPDMPRYVQGVINLRSHVIPAVDLRLKLHMPPREYDDRTCMIITRIDEHSIGFIVDTVSEVEDIPAEHVDSARNFKSELAQHNKYLSGIGRVGEEVKILLDVERLITGEEIEQIAAGA